MTHYIYNDIQSGEPAQDPDTATYSIMQLVKEHRQRFVFITSQGAIILRYMPLRMRRIIDSVRAKTYPRTMELLQRVEELRPYFDGIPKDQWKEDKADELKAIYDELRLTDMSALGVIVTPPVANMDDVDEIYNRLTEDEAEILALAVQALSTPKDPEEIDTTALEIAKANGLQIIPPDMLDELTISQAQFFTGRIYAENQRINQLIGNNTRVVQ